MYLEDILNIEEDIEFLSLKKEKINEIFELKDTVISEHNQFWHSLYGFIQNNQYENPEIYLENTNFNILESYNVNFLERKNKKFYFSVFFDDSYLFNIAIKKDINGYYFYYIENDIIKYRFLFLDNNIFIQFVNTENFLIFRSKEKDTDDDVIIIEVKENNNYKNEGYFHTLFFKNDEINFFTHSIKYLNEFKEYNPIVRVEIINDFNNNNKIIKVRSLEEQNIYDERIETIIDYRDLGLADVTNTFFVDENSYIPLILKTAI